MARGQLYALGRWLKWRKVANKATIGYPLVAVFIFKLKCMINDLLNALSYDDEAWEGEVSFPVLGDDVLLFIDASEDKKPTQAQTDKLAWLHDNIAALFPTIEARLYEYYQASCDRYRKKLGPDAQTLMPELNSQADVWEFVSDPGIYIGPDSDGDELQLEYECTFDVEHGLRLVILDNEIIYVGT